jgi:hypothetical protein
VATIPADVVLIQPWPLFTAYDTDGHPLIGGKLWSYQASTSTPKATFADPFLVVPNTNPVLLSADGNAVVYLDGFYKLRLTDAEDVLLWEVDNYEFESGAPAVVAGLISGMTETTPVTPSDGAGSILVPNGIPLGYRVEGALIRIDADFGSSNGLAQIAIGDATALDRWGIIGLTAGLQTTQQHFRDASRPIAATAYTVVLSALSGNFDAVGSCTIRTFWSSITGWT